MNRLLRILVTCGVTLLGAALVLEWRWGPVARLLGAETLAFRREMIAKVRAPPQSRGALVAWLGDSTIVSTPAARAYPLLVSDRAPGIASWVVESFGLNGFGYWALAEPVLRARPRAAVLIAHLRVRGDGARSPEDLLDQLPAREMLRATLLPLEARGLSRLRLALAPALHQPAAEYARTTLDGLRRGYRALSPWSRVKVDVPVALGVWGYVQGVARILEAYDRPVRERTPEIVMLGATVDRFARAGVPVLVVVTPIPVDALRAAGRYDHERFRARVDRIRTVVERTGGRLLDLHDFLPTDEMRDAGGHATQAGHARLAARILPAIRDLLGGGAP